MDDPSQRDREEIARLQREVALARFYLDRFADPDSFVWKTPEKSPQDFAREALTDMAAVRAQVEPVEAGEDAWFATGTGRMPKLPGGRAGFVEFHQILARQAMDAGKLGAARAALRVLRTSDFSRDAALAEALLAVLRDSRSPSEEIADAISRLTGLEPTPALRTPRK
jgi:hypothetical protein